jgi:Asp-tRNA(Asn)/Glu-tRNA(Gln) amidotransferase A subunit family amidase
MKNQALYQLGLRDALAALRAKHFSAEEYCAQLQCRIAERDSDIGVWAHYDPRQGQGAARRSAVHASNAPSRLPLGGVPIAIKDIIDTVDMPTEVGSPIYQGRVPERDAFVVERIKQLGAYVMGKTVTTEFAWSFPGKTRNPHNKNHTPGGSSSGSAAAVAAGFVPAALGTQTMGSIIRPAAFCGVVGYKPSYGLISRRGIHPFANTLDHVGVFARSVADAGFLAHLLMGFDANDASCVSTGGFMPGAFSIPRMAKPPRLALVHSPAWPLADEAQKNCLYENAETLRRAGARVDEVTLPALFDEALTAAQTIMRSEAALVFAPLQEKHPDKVSANIDDVVKTGRAFSAFDYLRALKLRMDLRATLHDLLRDYDAIITPPAPGEAPEGLGATGNPAFCIPWSLLGVPAITLPVKFGPKGLPLGMQIVGGYRDDQNTLGVANWCERKLGFAGLSK